MLPLCIPGSGCLMCCVHGVGCSDFSTVANECTTDSDLLGGGTLACCLLQLTHWYPGSGVKCLGPNSDVFLRTLRAGHGWESPRPPFEVSLHINARTASTSGRQEEGRSYYSSVNGTPLSCSLGAGQLPPGEEASEFAASAFCIEPLLVLASCQYEG